MKTNEGPREDQDYYTIIRLMGQSKGSVKSVNYLCCIKKLMSVGEVKQVFKNREMWEWLLSAYFLRVLAL